MSSDIQAGGGNRDSTIIPGYQPEGINTNATVPSAEETYPERPVDTMLKYDQQIDSTDYQNVSSQPNLPKPGANAADAGTVDILKFDEKAYLQSITHPNEEGLLTTQHREGLANVVVNDPEILALATRLGISPGEAQEKLSIADGSAFILLTQGLTEEQIKQLKFARAFPEAAAGLSTELNAKLQTIEAAIAGKMTGEFQMPASWKGASALNSTFLADEITREFDANFDAKLRALEGEGKLTKEQAVQLRTAHYMPDSSRPLSGQLSTLFSSIQEEVAKDVRSQYGAAVTWSPKPNTDSYTMMTTGFFRQEFAAQLDAYKPAMNPEVKNQIIANFADLSKLPPDIKQIAESVKTAATSATIAKFSLDVSWTPKITSVSMPANASIEFKLAQGVLETSKSIVDKYGALVAGMPEGAMKSSFVDYLKIIGIALNKLQELLYELSGSDSSTAKKLNAARMDSSISDIQRSQKQVDEAREKEKNTKRVNLGPLGDINGWLGKTLMVALSGPLFPFVMAYVVEQSIAEAKGEPSLVQSLAADMCEAMGDCGLGNFDWVASFAIAFVASTMGGPLFAMSLLNDAKAFQEMGKTCGMSETQCEIFAAVMNGIVQIAMAIAMAAATAGAGSPVVAAMVAKLGADTAKTVMTVLAVVQLVFTLSMAATQMAHQVQEARYQFDMEDVVGMLAAAEASSEEVRALVSILKKLISKLMDGLQAHSEDMITIASSQSKKYTDASAETTQAIQG